MMRGIGALMATAAVLAGAACGDDGGGGDGGTDDGHEGGAAPTEAEATEPPGWEVIEESEVEPVSIEQEPLWGSEPGAPLEVFRGAVIHDDSVVMFGGAEAGVPTRLGVMDADTGEMRWNLDEGDDLPGGDGARLWHSSVRRGPPLIVAQDGEWAVIVGYIERLPGGRQRYPGVVALSGESGEVVWKRSLVPTRPDGATEAFDLHVDALAADGGTLAAVITVEPWEAPGDAPVRVIFGLDAADGTVRWERSRSDLLPLDGAQEEGLAVADETVLLRLRAEDGGEQDQETETQYVATVLALDGATGEVRWERTDSGASMDIDPIALSLMTADDLALIRIPTDESSDQPVDPGTETLLVETETGEEVASFGSTASNCVSDGDSLIACQVFDGGLKLATFDVESREGGVSAQAMSVAFGYAGGVAHGRVFAGDQDRGVTMDRGANVVDDEVPGWFLTASDRYVMLRDLGEPAEIRYTVHRVVAE